MAAVLALREQFNREQFNREQFNREQFNTAVSRRRHLQVVVPGATTFTVPGVQQPARPSTADYRRRQVVTAVALIAMVWLVTTSAMTAASLFSGVGAYGPTGEAVEYVVQPGDTVWSIARSHQPSGDVRPLVERMVVANGGTDLVPGQPVIVTP